MAISNLASSEPTTFRQPIRGYAVPHVSLRSLSRILHDHRLSAHIVCKGQLWKVGIDTDESSTTEIHFENPRDMVSILERLSLRSLASGYIKGAVSFKPGILEAMPVIEAINLATDTKQTLCERMKEELFFLSKRFLPWKVTAFESLNHYAKSADAYSLMLDPYMQYTCGLFEKPSDNLGLAQLQKFYLIRDWFQARSDRIAGERHIDIGCGWGGLVSLFTKELNTVSVGLTNSPQQQDYARRVYDVRTILSDFSFLKNDETKYRFITVVGMIEHLTPSRRDELLRLIKARLLPGGLVYLQCIQKPGSWIGGDAYRLAQRYIFPGHHLESELQTKRRIQCANLKILQEIEHAPHYALTTKCWLENIERNKSKFVEVLGDDDFRLFCGYLAVASRLFASGRGSLKRYLISHSDES